MILEISYHELAELELNDAADFYELREPGLGPAFLETVHEAILQIGKHPKAAQVVRGNVGRKVLTRFPYSIIYFETPETIRILALAPQRRRPFYWRRRS